MPAALKPLAPLKALVTLQLALLAVVAVATVAGLPTWSLVDEGAHYDYVQKIAEDGRLPVLDEDLVSGETQAIADDVFPAVPRTPQERAGLAGQSYEGVQPPLYYTLVAPASLLVSDHLDRVTWLRGLNVLLLFGTVFLLWRLTVAVCGRERALGPFALALTALLWPGVVVRAVTVSNAGLELFTATAAILALWLAVQNRSPRALLAAGAVTGLVLLTSLKLVYVVPVLVGVAAWLVWKGSVRWPVALAALALPVLMLVPWMIFNLDHYGTLSTTEPARELQARLLGLTEQRFGLGDLPEKNSVLLRGLVPEEWWKVFLDAPVRWANGLVMLVLVGVPLALGLRLERGLRGRAYGILVAPLAAGWLIINVTVVVADWDTAGPRYLYPALPAFTVFAALALGTLWRREKAPALTPYAAAAVTILLCGVWAYMALTTPFTP